MATSAIDWPSSLPQQPLQQGYSESSPNNKIRTSMEVGPAKVRKRFTVGIRPYSVMYRLNVTDSGIFRTFYEDTLDDGVLAFNWPDPETGVLDSNSPVVRIIDDPVYSAEGNLFLVKFNLEVLP